jgi:hypothetical protein
LSACSSISARWSDGRTICQIPQHDIRDWAQRKPSCHPYLAHRSRLLRDALSQLHCELRLLNPPQLRIERRVLDDAFYRLIDRTFMRINCPGRCCSSPSATFRG